MSFPQGDNELAARTAAAGEAGWRSRDSAEVQANRGRGRSWAHPRR